MKTCVDCPRISYCDGCLSLFHPARGVLKTHKLVEPSATGNTSNNNSASNSGGNTSNDSASTSGGNSPVSSTLGGTVCDHQYCLFLLARKRDVASVCGGVIEIFSIPDCAPQLG